MAKLLIRAQAHYLDKLTQEEVDKMTKEERQSYDARSQIGDIIVVRPDGWVWGKEECLPNFVVVKIPDKAEDVKYLEESLMQDEVVPVILKVDSADWADEAKKAEFIQSNQMTAIPLVKSTSLEGTKEVSTVEGEQIKTYLLRIRKHQVDPTLIKDPILELKDLAEANLTIKEAVAIDATVWKPAEVIKEIF